MPSSRLDQRQRAAIRQLHVETPMTAYGHTLCQDCDERWPCQLTCTLDALEAVEAQRDRLLVHLHEAGRREGLCVLFDAVSLIDAMATAQGPIGDER